MGPHTSRSAFLTARPIPDRETKPSTDVDPILDDQPRYPLELPNVVRDQSDVQSQSVYGDQQIHGADGHTLTLEMAPKRPIGSHGRRLMMYVQMLVSKR